MATMSAPARSGRTIAASICLSVVDHTMLQPMLSRLLDEEQFLSPFGVRSVSKIHATHRDLGVLPGVGMAMIEYVPGESNSALFGGNSNWRGPIWLPVNYMLIQAIEKFHRFLGDEFMFAVPCLGGEKLTLNGIANLIADRVANIYRRGAGGVAPAMQTQPPFRDDPHWRDLLLFYEYFHAETGQGLGASHQTGWTGLIANLVFAPLSQGYSRLLEQPANSRSGRVMSAQMTIGSMSGAKIAAAPSAVLIVYAGALLQGMTLVSFPAVSAMLKQTLALSDADYGAIFLPQVALAIVGAVAGGALARTIGLKALFALALAANAASQALLTVIYAFAEGTFSRWAMIFCATAWDCPT